MTRPANTVGGDFYDVLPLRRRPGHRRRSATSPGKGSPAALLMALLLAVLRTLVDEELEPARAGRAAEHADLPAQPGLAVHHAVLRRLHAGDRRAHLRQRRTEPAAASAAPTAASSGSAAPASRSACSKARPTARSTRRVDPGEMLVLYSDGITEAEDPAGQPFEEAGLQAVVDSHRR